MGGEAALGFSIVGVSFLLIFQDLPVRVQASKCIEQDYWNEGSNPHGFSFAWSKIISVTLASGTRSVLPWIRKVCIAILDGKVIPRLLDFKPRSLPFV